MASRGKRTTRSLSSGSDGGRLASSTEELLLAALARGDDPSLTGRYLITYREGALAEGVRQLKSAAGLRVADAREFKSQEVMLEDLGDADAMVFPEIDVALVSGDATQMKELALGAERDLDGAVEAVEPEYFVFANNRDYMRGFLGAANAIARDLGLQDIGLPKEDDRVDAEVLGVTWGLAATRVPSSSRTGAGIKVAVLDTGMDLGHPDFAGRPFVSSTFVGQPVQDLHGHGTHCIGTATGPKGPAGTTPRYGIAHAASIFVGKVLTNSGSGTGAGVLAGMNWAIANRCQVISMSLGSQSPVQASYTNAGAAALRNGCLIIAAAGNAASNTGSPANSPTIMSVAALDAGLQPSSFSNFGKVEIAAPGRDVFSSWPRPTRYRTISGTSMATPHVAGCAALWAQTSSTLRGSVLWRKLQSTARHLPYSVARVGAGLVQAP